ncbi:MAG: hypothetical protein OYI31_02385 [Chloroflexota bacterium]|nr:hypothetical protein [Chloroflexota bacterium]MDE2941651.1 hypothetical protein [Chloroflexota bacterium]MDE3267294.1 hypothetical protein [Chloroflexota bacterium]
MTNTAEAGSVASPAEQLGAAYEAYGAADRALHERLLSSVQRPEDVAVHAVAEGDDCWTVTVCTSDWVGALATIAGLFPAYGMDIESADAFTLRVPASRPSVARRSGGFGPGGRRPWRPAAARPAPVSRRLLDVFRVRALSATSDDVWERFREELQGFVALLSAGRRDAARERLIDRVSDALSTLGSHGERVYPVAVEVSNDASPDYTQVSIRSADTVGFLYTFANALAVLNVNVERAEIRTVEGETRDVFMVTGRDGGKITGEEQLREVRVAAALIKQFTHLLPSSPNPAMALRQFNALTLQMLSRPDWSSGLRDLESATVMGTLAQLMGVSEFLWEDFLRMQYEELFPVVVDLPSLDEHRPVHLLEEELDGLLEQLDDHQERVDVLNRFKDREMFRIDLRHITGRIGFREFAMELTALGEVTVRKAAALAYRLRSEQYGEPLLSDGRVCSWCVCALGKFGGREMGFGSDVELIFVYEGEGSTSGSDSLPNARFFAEFVRAFLGALKTKREGIFEVDMRLRPHGNAGALACSLDGFRDYYSEGGPARQFERMALVRLRPVAGDAALSERVTEARDAFVYTGTPLDIENVRHLRGRQADELVQRGALNAKYSRGGLTDVEYFVQAWQVAKGREDESLRVTNTLDAIARLADGGYVTRGQAGEMEATYGFLRRLIDALRVVRGHAKDLTVPAVDSREFAYLVRRLRFESAEELRDAIAENMAAAERLWQGAVPGGGG